MDLDNYTDNLYEKIVQQIRLVRREKEIQQKQIAEALGMNQVSYSDAESGKTRFTPTRLFAAIKYLEINLNDLLKNTSFQTLLAEESPNTYALTSSTPTPKLDNSLVLEQDLNHLLKAMLIQNTTIQEMREQNKQLFEQNKHLQQDIQEVKALLKQLLTQQTNNPKATD